MSASGPPIFDDDLAGDVQEGYRQLLEDRVPDDEATRRTIAEWQGLDADEEPVFLAGPGGRAVPPRAAGC